MHWDDDMKLSHRVGIESNGPGNRGIELYHILYLHDIAALSLEADVRAAFTVYQPTVTVVFLVAGIGFLDKDQNNYNN